MIGVNRIGTVKIGDAFVGGTVPTFTPFLRELADAHPDLFIDSPFLVFYDLVVGSNSVHVVDFADSEITVTPGRMRFDSTDYFPLRVTQPVLSENAEGSFPVVSLDIADPLRIVLSFVRDNNNLQGATITMRVIKLKDIGTPSLARTRTFDVKEPVSLEGPPRISLSFGPIDLSNHTVPSVSFSRALCPNNYEARHEFTADRTDTGHHLCTAPSDDFQAITLQSFETPAWNTGVRVAIGQPLTTTLPTTITRHPDEDGVLGSFITDGFVANGVIKAGGWNASAAAEVINNGISTIASVTATTITINAPFDVTTAAEETGVALLQGSDAEQTLLHGWRVINGTRLRIPRYRGGVLSQFAAESKSNTEDIALSPNRGFLFGSYWRTPNEWKNTNRQSPFVYKRILDNVKGTAGFDAGVGESTAVIDVNIKLGDIDQNFHLGTLGILVQSVDQPASWIFWGLNNFDSVSGDNEKFHRVTTNGVTGTDTTLVGEPNAYRVKRNGSNWELYSRDETADRFPATLPAWTLDHTASLSMSGDLNVGICGFAKDNIADSVIRSLVYHFRFDTGGFIKCNRTLAACTERENTIQRNAFSDLPDGIVHF